MLRMYYQNFIGEYFKYIFNKSIYQLNIDNSHITSIVIKKLV